MYPFLCPVFVIANQPLTKIDSLNSGSVLALQGPGSQFSWDQLVFLWVTSHIEGFLFKKPSPQATSKCHMSGVHFAIIEIP